MPLTLPRRYQAAIEGQQKWLDLIKEAQLVVADDVDILKKSAKSLRLKPRQLPPEVIGRSYAAYCSLINRLYDAYLNSVQLQRASYIIEIVKILVKRLYELRNELMHLIVNDYFYIDQALAQSRMTPYDIEIIVPYHLPLEARSDTFEELLQQMWVDAVKRKNAPPPKVKPPKPEPADSTELLLQTSSESEEEDIPESVAPSEHTIIPEEFIQAVVIQAAERFRQFYVRDFKRKSIFRKTYYKTNNPESPDYLKGLAAKLIQKVYREYMKLKRLHADELKRNIILGILPDPFKKKMDYELENNAIYERRRQKKLEINKLYMAEMEKENKRLLYYKWEDQVEDITVNVREWFKEWYFGYGFFPEFPYELEGGTLLVIREDYPTIEERMIEDEKYLAATKGKTKEQLKQEKQKLKEEAEMKAELEREAQKKEKENLFKMRCYPPGDPGYRMKQSEYADTIAEKIRNYFASWSIYDKIPAESSAEIVYGYIKEILMEDLMNKIHVDCRKYVDELMRLDLKLLIKTHQLMYKRVGWKYPKMRPRPRPKPVPIPKVFNVDSKVLERIEKVFDYNLITKPTNRIKDIYGDTNYAAYECNIADPNVRYPPPGYGDIRQRLVLSCVFGSGLEPSAKRTKAVLLVGPDRNGKSFLADCVAGEMILIKLLESKMPITLPRRYQAAIEGQQKWLDLIKEAQLVVADDVDILKKSAKSLRLKPRQLPPEVIGRSYAAYCSLINRLYDAYLNSVQLQRASYIIEIVKILVKRLYELRNELMHLIVNDYFYIDQALAQSRMTPYDIEIIVPYHLPLEARSDTFEELLQQMWVDAVKRKNAPPPKVKPPKPEPADSTELLLQTSSESEEEDIPESVAPSEHTIIPEEFIQAVVIQAAERFRQFYVRDFKRKSIFRKTYYKTNNPESPDYLKGLAAKLIQKVYREYMKLKRLQADELKRNIILGILPDPFKKKMDYELENNAIYEKRRQKKLEINKLYMAEMEKENKRLLYYKWEDQVEDITVNVREWFKEWYFGYGFFPEFPYELEGGTLLVIREDYPTIEERMIEDEKYLAATKGKTKEQLKQEKQKLKEEAEMKAELEREAQKKEKENLFKMRCYPPGDPGYRMKQSEYADTIAEKIRNYFASWSIYDKIPAESSAEIVYGYIKEILMEDLMNKIHVDCRKYVDELMRLDLKLLIKTHQLMYKRVGWKYPKMRPRPRPKPVPIPKVFNVDRKVLERIEKVFDYNLITKPTNRIKDIYGDTNYAAYECNIADPNVRYPPPGYGDIRQRLVLSCVFGSGLEPSAKRTKAVLLVGPDRNGKSFLADCVAGEMNAVKLDISPEVFTAVVNAPKKILAQVFNAAKVFKPAVIFLKNIERVFAKKVPFEQRHLKAKKIKGSLVKLVKGIPADEKIIFIATSTYPKSAKIARMMSMFTETILVPRTDYGSVQLFLSSKILSIRSIPRNYCFKSLAQILEGVGFGLIIEMYNQIMTAERIVKLNHTPLSPFEFLELMMERDIEPMTVEEYKEEYMAFALKYSPFKNERAEYDIINATRALFYQKMEESAKKKEEMEKKK